MRRPLDRLDLVWTDALSVADGDAFDRFVDDARGGHYAQTRAWAPVATAGRAFEARYFLARDAGRVVGAALVLRATLPGALGLPLPAAIVERGPVCDDAGDVGRVAGALVRIARRHGVARLEVMPYWAEDDARRAEEALARARFALSQRPDGAHAATLRVALGEDDAATFAGGDHESLRRHLRIAERAGASVRRGGPEDVLHLARLYADMMGAQGRSAKPREYYERLAESVLSGARPRGAIFVCTHDAEIVSAVLAVRHARLATFAMGASCAAPRKFAKMALPVREAIRWARDEGCAAFDLGGIPTEGDADEKRARIAAFKQDFSKRRVTLARAHARWF